MNQSNTPDLSTHLDFKKRHARPLEASIHIPDSADGFQPTSENVIIR